ncbi:MAG: ROK family transcriptional regulator [Negativicutes bacterium]|nr:ROK family transcriptional regulator [Negativicutes bacterium]
MRDTGNSKSMKRLNRMTALNIIKENEPISRQQLAELTGLTPAAVTGIIRELIDTGFVKEVGLGPSRGGRRPVKLKVNSDAGYVMGLEVTSKETAVAIADLKHTPRFIESVMLDMKEPCTGTAGLVETVRRIMAAPEHRKKKFVGIGIAFPALLTAGEGRVKRAVNLGPEWNNFPVKEVLETELGIPVFAETNSKVAALGEKWFGGGRQCNNLIYVNLGEGISAGILSKDDIVQGSLGHAGQIGHAIMIEDGPLCNCGNRGCLEAICGIPALLRKVGHELPFIDGGDALKRRIETRREIKIRDVLEAALEADSYARDMLRQVGRFAGLAIANMINFYNPDEVFIGGRLAVAADVYLEEMKSVIYSHAFPEVGRATRITVSQLGADSGVIGACALALRNLLKAPDSDILDLQREPSPKRRDKIYWNV